jgi:hypothetical protein
LFDGKSARHPNADQFIDDICKQLHQAIEIYEKTTLSKIKIFFFFFFSSSMIFLVNISDQTFQINLEARQALNVIETGRNKMFHA